MITTLEGYLWKGKAHSDGEG